MDRGFRPSREQAAIWSIGQVVEWSIGGGEAQGAKGIAHSAKSGWQEAAGSWQNRIPKFVDSVTQELNSSRDTTDKGIV